MSSVTFSSTGCVVVLGLLLGTAAPATAEIITVELTPTSQGGGGNNGSTLSPFDSTGALAPLTITATTAIPVSQRFDPFATGAAGSVYIGGSGAGVQDTLAQGSFEISGMAGSTIEEIIFTFDELTPRDSLVLTLKQYKPGNGLGNKDDPLVFVYLLGGTVLTFDETNGITSASGQRGELVLAALLGEADLVERIVIREINDHIGVEKITFFSVAVPTPGSLALLGMAALMIRHRRRVRAS